MIDRGLRAPPFDTEPSHARLADRYRVLLEVGRRLTGALSTDELFRTLYRETSRVLEAEGFYVSLYDEERDVATVVFFADRGIERPSEISYRGSESRVLRTGRGGIVEEDEGSSSLMILGDESAGVTRSAVSAPLLFEDRVIGALSAQSYRPGAYGEEDLQLLRGIADMAAVAVENARRLAELERKGREAERIEEIGRSLVGSLEPGDVLRKVIDAALELLDADGCTIWFLEGERTIRVEASGGAIPLAQGMTWELEPALWTGLLEGRRRVALDDSKPDPRIPPDLRHHLRSGSGLVVPLRVDGDVAGALSVRSRKPRAFGDDDVRLLEVLASQASVALENARLHRSVQNLSLTDPLTGLPNRRHLGLHLERQMAAARRGRPLSTVIFDLDNFKRCNDTLGHQAGDEILTVFAEILDAEGRTMNLVARYGGDEFVSVLADTPEEGARIHAERVANRVRTDDRLAPHGISVSYGIAHFRSGMGGGEELIRAADEDLYRSKTSRPGSR